MADRIEFVVMTSGAGNSQAKKSLGQYIDLIIRETNMLIQSVGWSEAMEDKPQVRRTNSLLVQP